MNARLAAATLLGMFYLWVAYAMTNPRVGPEYRDYYIERTTREIRPGRYTASAEDGVDFSRPGVPEFLVAMSGMASVQRWGRWTDPRLGEVVRLDYRHPWSGEVCASLLAAPSALHAGKEAMLRIGPMEGRFRVDGKEARWHHVQFSLDRPVAQVEIEPADDDGPIGAGVDAPPQDRTALGLHRLVVRAGRCAEPSVLAGLR